MRDDKLCPTCGADLIWKGNVMEGRLECQHCAQVETISEPAELARLKDEEDWEDAVDSNIKALNKGKKFEDREFDDPAIQLAAPIDFKPTRISDRPSNPALRGAPPPWAGMDWSGENYYQATRRATRAGRTHAMVLRALERLNEGNSVVILVHSTQMAEHVVGTLHRLGMECTPQGRYKLPHHPCVLSVVHVAYSPRGYPRSTVVFADHAIFDQDKTTRDYLDKWWSRHEIRS